MAKNRQKSRKKQKFRKTVKNGKNRQKCPKDKNFEKLSKKQSKMMKKS